MKVIEPKVRELVKLRDIEPGLVILYGGEWFIVTNGRNDDVPDVTLVRLRDGRVHYLQGSCEYLPCRSSVAINTGDYNEF